MQLKPTKGRNGDSRPLSAFSAHQPLLPISSPLSAVGEPLAKRIPKVAEKPPDAQKTLVSLPKVIVTHVTCPETGVTVTFRECCSSVGFFKQPYMEKENSEKWMK